MTAKCSNCNTEFRGVDRNEDGSPAIETTRCAHPGCEVYLCRSGCEHLSAVCEACGKRVCVDHYLNFISTGVNCIECAAIALDDEPECGCTQSDADIFDPRGCEYHDSRSAWNVRRRAVTSAQEYEQYVKETA